jgi:beta propeller repeat protein
MYNLSISKETQITTTGSAYNPAICDDRIVWEDYRSGHNIYMYNLSTSQETQITASGIAYNPAVYGDRIVWQGIH